MKIILESPIERTRRVEEIESLFSLPAEEICRREWNIELPLTEKEWTIGLIVGPSGSGKSTTANRIFPLARTFEHNWSKNAAIIDEFPQSMRTKEIAAALTAVGFSTVPAWLRPFSTLSTGERFRVEMARAIAETEPGELLVVDEFTSTIDRTVAQIASAATAKATRHKGIKLVAVTCHADVSNWLEPDWIYKPHIDEFKWCEQGTRPEIELKIYRATNKSWQWFQNHHYLSKEQNGSSQKFIGVTNNRIASLTSAIYQPHPQRPGFREHRSVCLPDYQGIGIGNALADFVGAMFHSTKLPYRSVTSHPAMIFHRAKSKQWKMIRPPSQLGIDRLKGWEKSSSTGRVTATFEYVGPPEPEAAEYFGII